MKGVLLNYQTNISLIEKNPFYPNNFFWKPTQFYKFQKFPSQRSILIDKYRYISKIIQQILLKRHIKNKIDN